MKYDGTATQHGVVELVGFIVAGEEFGVDILSVQEIIRMVEITKVPNSRDYVDGIINIRGKVIPIIDFRKRFNIEDYGEEPNDRRIIIVRLDKTIIGITVDKVSQVFKLPVDQIEAPPNAIKGYDSEAISGVGKLGEKLIILLDLQKLFTDVELSQLAEAA
jgi:purine-binding chemotaxis protein CheW